VVPPRGVQSREAPSTFRGATATGLDWEGRATCWAGLTMVGLRMRPCYVVAPKAQAFNESKRFNSNQCSSCHLQPAVGGTSPAPNPLIAVAKLNGAKNTLPWFITSSGPIREARFKRNPNGTPDGGVHDLFVITGRTDAAGCNIAQPNFRPAGNPIIRRGRGPSTAAALRRSGEPCLALRRTRLSSSKMGLADSKTLRFVTGGDNNGLGPTGQGGNHNIIFRIPTPVFGAGLIEAIPDTAILKNMKADTFMKARLGISGHPNAIISGTANLSANDGTITRRHRAGCCPDIRSEPRNYSP
jgi:hypothetical protein